MYCNQLVDVTELYLSVTPGASCKLQNGKQARVRKDIPCQGSVSNTGEDTHHSDALGLQCLQQEAN